MLEAVHDKLVGTGDEIKSVDMQEFFSDLRSEKPSGASWAHSPCIDVFRVRPHHVGKWSLVRNFHPSFEKSDLVKGLD